MRHHGAWVRQYMRFYAPSSVLKKRNSIGGIPPISRSSRGYVLLVEKVENPQFVNGRAVL